MCRVSHGPISSPACALVSTYQERTAEPRLTCPSQRMNDSSRESRAQRGFICVFALPAQLSRLPDVVCTRLVLEFVVGMYSVLEANTLPTPFESATIPGPGLEVSAVRTVDDVGYSHSGSDILLAFFTVPMLAMAAGRYVVLGTSGTFPWKLPEIPFGIRISCGVKTWSTETKGHTSVNPLLASLLAF